MLLRKHYEGVMLEKRLSTKLCWKKGNEKLKEGGKTPNCQYLQYISNSARGKSMIRTCTKGFQGNMYNWPIDFAWPLLVNCPMFAFTLMPLFYAISSRVTAIARSNCNDSINYSKTISLLWVAHHSKVSFHLHASFNRYTATVKICWSWHMGKKWIQKKRVRFTVLRSSNWV